MADFRDRLYRLDKVIASKYGDRVDALVVMANLIGYQVWTNENPNYIRVHIHCPVWPPHVMIMDFPTGTYRFKKGLAFDKEYSTFDDLLDAVEKTLAEETFKWDG